MYGFGWLEQSMNQEVFRLQINFRSLEVSNAVQATVALCIEYITLQPTTTLISCTSMLPCIKKLAMITELFAY